MPRKLTISEIKERIWKIHGDVVILDESTYINTQIKARFIDKDYGDWWTIPNNMFCIKSSHPLRKNLLDIDEIKRRIKKVHEDTIILDENTYKDTNTKCRFIDKDYGEWWAIPKSIFYGHKHPKRANENRKKTMIKKYGVENPSQSGEIKEKKKQTCLKNYGVEHPMQSKKIKEKSKQTCLKNYGVEHPAQNPEIALRVARSSNDCYILEHWETNKEIICKAGWEKATVEYFNKNQINYDWQIKAFKMPSGKTYRPDCYLPDQDLWVEIKGYFYPDAQDKWEWFHKKHPNSELWNKEKLKELKIL